MSAQQCTQCAAGSYSLGSGVRFDQWDSMPAGFSSLATSLESGPRGDDKLSCNRSASGMQKKKKGVNLDSYINAVFSRRHRSSSWLPQGNYLMSNRDECTVSLIYAVHLKKQGSVSFEYQYPDHNLLFEFFVGSKHPFLSILLSHLFIKHLFFIMLEEVLLARRVGIVKCDANSPEREITVHFTDIRIVL